MNTEIIGGEREKKNQNEDDFSKLVSKFVGLI